ncbi:MAG: DUF2089 domain-containing protein [Armatimonadota bacterium]
MLRTRRITECPSCESPLEVTELSCTVCQTRLQGVFPAVPLARIASEHQQFIETFVLCRGIIRDVERVLGISYPTVRARLDAAVSALEIAVRPANVSALPDGMTGPEEDTRRREILRLVAAGDLTPEAAAKRLRSL